MVDISRLSVEVLQHQRSAAMLSPGQPFTLDRDEAWDLLGRILNALQQRPPGGEHR